MDSSVMLFQGLKYPDTVTTMGQGYRSTGCTSTIILLCVPGAQTLPSPVPALRPTRNQLTTHQVGLDHSLKKVKFLTSVFILGLETLIAAKEIRKKINWKKSCLG